MYNKEIKTMDFWSLLIKHSIEIPKIQRDYAQGRDSVKTQIIRNNILDAFFKAIENGEKLNLDFVYGTVTKDNKLIPLDGQQRLTTLFLLHWYLASISGNLSKETKKIFLKFTYETRLSSRRFCEALVNNNLPIDDSKKLSSQIMDNSWFYFTWKKDPTIKAMLIMLDAIDTKFKGKFEVWKKLTTTNLIEFEFLPLDKFNLTDELYVKMNARGKALSDFENFKSWLDEKLEEKTNETFKKEWSLKLDTVWTDLFWRNDNEDFSIDEEMINFFRGMAMFNYIEKFEETNENKKDFEKRIGALNNIKNYYVSNEEFENIFFKDEKNDIFCDINCFLDFYSNNETTVLNLLKKVNFWNEGEDNLFLKFIQEPTYSLRVLFYGLFKYILKHSDNFENNEKEIIRFFRVLRNLVVNTEITASNFKNILIAINKLVEADDIIICLSNENLQLQGFDGAQTKEEQLKATLILLPNLDWEEEIIEVENHLLFKGNIGFIIEFSNLSIEKFRYYFNLLNLIFDKNGNKFSKENLFQRALLTKGDYTKNGDKLFNNNKEWKFYLKQSFDKIDNLKKLLDDESIDKENLSNSLNDIINKYLSDEANINKSIWRFNLIKYPNIWNVSEYKYLRRNEKHVALRRKDRDYYGDNLPINSFREIIISKLLELNPNFKLIQPHDKMDISFHNNRIVKNEIIFYKNDWIGICLDYSQSYFPTIYFNSTNLLEIGIRKQKFEQTDNTIEIDNQIFKELDLKSIGNTNRFWAYHKEIDYSNNKFEDISNLTHKIFDEFNKLSK